MVISRAIFSLCISWGGDPIFYSSLIVARAHISTKPVETDKIRATDKLDLHSRAQMVRSAAEHEGMNSAKMDKHLVRNGFTSSVARKDP